MSLHVFGIRHHGPGSARSLREALDDLKPDAVLIEGPTEGEALLPLAAEESMTPPVALLIYQPDKPARAAYYPFAEFSPEWQAIQYALRAGAALRLMDLPQTHTMALDAAELEKAEEQAALIKPVSEAAAAPTDTQIELVIDPLRWLAEAAGYQDGEAWWERMVEQRRASADLFQGILEAMTALRQEIISPNTAANRHEPYREAWMRQTIRAAQSEKFKRIAVVCGAWHAPVLAEMPSGAKEDATLLKGLPKVKVEATWVPWTYTRLSRFTGYGAGITSPGWYEHLWAHSDDVTMRWATLAAHLLRGEGFIASTAQVIDTVRLAETLAAMRGHASPGLPELQEAIRATLANGLEEPLRLIQRKLIVGEVLGRVPDTAPTLPLQHDLHKEQKRLRMPAEDIDRAYDLDLRKPTDLERSHLLHRLTMLKIDWGKQSKMSRAAKGTFHEAWQTRWMPEYAVAVIEASIWGNTIAEAATAFARDLAEKSTFLPELTALAGQALLANLSEAVAHVMRRLDEAAALATDVAHLMEAIPPLTNILRYGNVRQSDVGSVAHIVDGMITRVCVGLPGACASLNDDAAAEMHKRIVDVEGAITLLQNADHLEAWRATLLKMLGQSGLHGLIAGRCCRLLLDAGAIDGREAQRRIGLALTLASDPAHAGAWAEGFLRGSGIILLHDDTLWQTIDQWVNRLSSDAFQELLPLLRRTFSSFPAGERRQLGERVKRGGVAIAAVAQTDADFDTTQADAALPLVVMLLGLENPPDAGGDS